MNKKLIVCLVVFILAIGLIAICYDIKIKVDVEPHTIKPSTVSFLIIGGKSDELIKQKILENPLLLNEISFQDTEEFEGDWQYKTPLITAISYGRYELLKFMIEHGASVQNSREYLKKMDKKKYISILDSYTK